MIHIQMNIGAELTRDGLPLTARERCDGLKAIEAQAIRDFGGFTALPTAGAWRNGDDVHSESGIQLEILTDLSDGPSLRACVRSLAETARDALRQQCVLVRVRECEAEFV